MTEDEARKFYESDEDPAALFAIFDAAHETPMDTTGSHILAAAGGPEDQRPGMEPQV